VERVSKGSLDLPSDLAKALSLDATVFRRPTPNEPRSSGSAAPAAPFTPLVEVEMAIDAPLLLILAAATGSGPTPVARRGGSQELFFLADETAEEYNTDQVVGGRDDAKPTTMPNPLWISNTIYHHEQDIPWTTK
jgi:hypothetical protein